MKWNAEIRADKQSEFDFIFQECMDTFSLVLFHSLKIDHLYLVGINI